MNNAQASQHIATHPRAPAAHPLRLAQRQQVMLRESGGLVINMVAENGTRWKPTKDTN